jgi:uncharacterized protein (DUF362 family)
MESMQNNKVAVVQVEKAEYPKQSPFNPYENFPEYPFPGQLAPSENYAYKGVRQLFYHLGLDSENWNTKAWNPLGSLLNPGMTVVIKPNFVLSHHKKGKNIYSIITHPSILRAVADYCWIALNGNGKIIIADAPQYDCDFLELINITKLECLVDFYSSFTGIQVNLLDLRNYWSRGKHFSSLLEPLPGDPQGNLLINLGEKSALYGKPFPEKLYGAVYDRNETISHQIGERHEYELSRTVLNADLVISIPKLKVHKKVGVTLNSKGLVGIVTNKNCLVHYTLTSPKEGGDQYPDGLLNPMEEKIIQIERWMYDHLLATKKISLEYFHRLIYWIHNNSTRRLGIKVAEEKRMLDAGNWYGNDSAWRMTTDLLKVFYFSDRNGYLHDKPQRRMFSIIDGIMGGENNGPLEPDPKSSGILLAGENLIAVDLVASRLMGFDPLKMRLYKYLLTNMACNFGIHSLQEITVVSTKSSWVNCLNDYEEHFLDFTPHPGWVGHLEI